MSSSRDLTFEDAVVHSADDEDTNSDGFVDVSAGSDDGSSSSSSFSYIELSPPDRAAATPEPVVSSVDLS